MSQSVSQTNNHNSFVKNEQFWLKRLESWQHIRTLAAKLNSCLTEAYEARSPG